MSDDKQQSLEDKLKRFCKQGDKIICTRIFKWSNNNCYICGQTPMEWHHVLLNSISNEMIDVEFSCLIEMKKMMEEMGSDQKILFFKKYAAEANHLNNQHAGTAAVLVFNANTKAAEQMLSQPHYLDYQQVKLILDYTSKFEKGLEADLFFQALDIYVDRKYYIYDGLEDQQKTGNVDEAIANYFREEWERSFYDETEYESASYKMRENDKDCPF